MIFDRYDKALIADGIQTLLICVGIFLVCIGMGGCIYLAERGEHSSGTASNEPTNAPSHND